MRPLLSQIVTRSWCSLQRVRGRGWYRVSSGTRASGGGRSVEEGRRCDRGVGQERRQRGHFVLRHAHLHHPICLVLEVLLFWSLSQAQPLCLWERGFHFWPSRRRARATRATGGRALRKTLSVGGAARTGLTRLSARNSFIVAERALRRTRHSCREASGVRPSMCFSAGQGFEVRSPLVGRIGITHFSFAADDGPGGPGGADRGRARFSR